MKIEVSIKKTGAKWCATASLLDISVISGTKNKALEELRLLVRDLADGAGVLETAGRIFIDLDVKAAVALCIKRQRAASGLSFQEASRLLGKESKNYWATYEWGQRSPSVEQLEKMLGALGVDLVLGSVEGD